MKHIYGQPKIGWHFGLTIHVFHRGFAPFLLQICSQPSQVLLIHSHEPGSEQHKLSGLHPRKKKRGSVPNLKPAIRKPHTTYHKPHTADHTPQTTRHSPQTTNYKRQTTYHKPQATRHKPQATNHEPQTRRRLGVNGVRYPLDDRADVSSIFVVVSYPLAGVSSPAWVCPTLSWVCLTRARVCLTLVGVSSALAGVPNTIVGVYYSLAGVAYTLAGGSYTRARMQEAAGADGVCLTPAWMSPTLSWVCLILSRMCLQISRMCLTPAWVCPPLSWVCLTRARGLRTLAQPPRPASGLDWLRCAIFA